MSFRDRMHVKVSKAEVDLRIALQEHGLSQGMFTDLQIDIVSTKPDYYWPTQGVAVYLDGPVHNSPTAEARDERITETLRKRGLKVLRFSYIPPISRKQIDWIVSQIKEALKQ